MAIRQTHQTGRQEDMIPIINGGPYKLSDRCIAECRKVLGTQRAWKVEEVVSSLTQVLDEYQVETENRFREIEKEVKALKESKNEQDESNSNDPLPGVSF